MNAILRPITPDGLVGYDEFNQLFIWRPQPDGSKIGTIIGDPRKHKCRICGQGWLSTSESMWDQSYWRDYKEWVHRSCEIRYYGLIERDMWSAALCAAVMIFDEIVEIPNQYWVNTEWVKDLPWYQVTPLYTKRPLTLGKRKRVYELRIEAGEGPYDADLARQLFAKEDVTKRIQADQLYIHAWGREKAAEYLKAFAKILDRERVVREAREKSERQSPS